MYRLVVVDDEYIVVEGIRALLKRLGTPAEVAGTAQDGRTALALIRETRPDMVITDIRIPYMDGLSLIESCREFLPETEYIVISGYQEFEYVRTALRLGALDYIDKPITQDKLAAALGRYDERKRGAAGASLREEDGRASECSGAPECPGESSFDMPAAAERAEAGGHTAIVRALSYIQQNYDRDIGLLELSELVGMNPAYLSVLFKENVGISFIKYLTGMRIEKAKQMLAEGRKASEVGTAVGYNDPHYFYEIFKKNTGMTPSEYKGRG